MVMIAQMFGLSRVNLSGMGKVDGMSFGRLRTNRGWLDFLGLI